MKNPIDFYSRPLRLASAIALLACGGLSAHLVAQQLDVLVIGSTHSFSEGNENGVVQQKAFNPSSIATHLQGILDQDPAIAGTVNVEFEDIYKTKTLTVNYSGSSVYDFTSHCYSLAQHYFWPDGKAARLANLRGEGDHQWDYIVLSFDPYIMANFPGMVAEGVKLIQDEVARSANPAQILLLAQWPESGSSFTANQFNEIVHRVGGSADITVVPAGKAWDSYGSKDTSASHPTPRGAYLAAASIYSKIYNRSAKTSGYAYPSVGSAIADHSLSVIQANAVVPQYSGTYTAINPFQMKYLSKRVVSFRETGTSTEDRLRDALNRLDDVHRITFNTTGYAGVPGTRWDFHYGRGNDRWEDDKDYEVDPNKYDWVYGFPMHHYTLANAQNTMPYGIDKHYFYQSAYEDGTDLGIAYNMIRPNTREPDWPEAVRSIPIRMMWQKMAEVSPGFNPLGDATHMNNHLNDASASFMYTLLSGRCPIIKEPEVAGTAEWMQWLGHKIGYETAWQMSHLTTRAPGFRVLPASTAATTVTPTTSQTMTVEFALPPQHDVTVNVSVSNTNAAIVGSKRLVFTPQNYNVPQTVRIAGLPGSLASESFDVVFSTSSDDEVYHNLSDSWSYTINRNPTATLTRVNQADTPITANQNLAATIPVNVTGATSSNTIIAGPTYGKVTWSGNNLVYTPDDLFLGKDGIAFAVNHNGTLTVGYLEITVNDILPNGRVVYSGNGSTGGAPPVDGNTYTQGSTVTVLGNTGNLIKAGSTFSGWNTEADGSGTTHLPGSTFAMGSSGVFLHAQWDAVPSYTVSYNGNSNTGGTAPANQTKLHDGDLTVTSNYGNLTRSGHTFGGWNTAPDGSGTNYAVGAIYGTNAPLTLYAKWNLNIYSVTYNANGATSGSSPGNQTKTFGVPLTLRNNTGNYAKTGFSFIGWNTKADGTGTDYPEGGAYTANSNVTLYAKWTDSVVYTISYNANGATGGTVPASQTKSAGIDRTLATNTGGLVRSGYTFSGWNTAANGGGVGYAEGGNYSSDASVILYAAWTPNAYTVTFNANGGGTPSPSNKSVTYDSTYGALATVTRSGYAFDGWFTAASGGSEVTASTSVTTAGDHTLHAQWSLMEMSVVTNTTSVNVPEGGTQVFQVKLSDQPAGNITVTVSRTSGDPNITVQSGGSLNFTTGNWDSYQTVTLAAAGDPDDTDSSAIITCDAGNPAFTAKVITATEIDSDTTLTVTSGGNGTTVPNGAVIVGKGSPSAVSALANEGYDFEGWTVTGGSATFADAGASSTTATISGPATVQANFTPKVYLVTYNGNGSTSGTPPANDEKIHDVDLTLATNSGNLTKTDFSFVGWNTAADGSGTDYDAGETYSDNAPLTLYAKWTPGADGTWAQTGAGTFDWGTAGNWTGNIVPSGSDRTAFFTPNITGDQIVNLDAPRTIGNITFTDATTSSHNLTISGANALTLSRSSDTSLIDVTQSNRTLFIASSISGSSGLQKNGPGVLNLSGANDYTGGTTLNGGTVIVNSNAALGSASTSITVSGNSALTSAAPAATNVEHTRAISLGSNTLTLQNTTASTTASFSGTITGTGGISVGAGAIGNPNTVALSNAGNDFTGNLTLIAAGNSNLFVSFASIGDGGAISLGRSGWRRVVQYNGATNLVLDNRRIDLTADLGPGNNGYDGGGNPGIMFENNGTGTITFNADMTVASGKTGTFFLGGSNSGNNSFAGIIPNSSGGSLGIAKHGSGKWILTRDNTFEGNARAVGGILSVAKIADATVAQPLGVGAIIQLGDRNNTGNLEFTGSSPTETNKQIQLGGSVVSHAGGGGILNNGAGTLTFDNPTFNITQASTTGDRTLTLGGSNAGGNIISGIIQNNNGTDGFLALSKIDGGTWILNGSNSYTGTTGVTAGKLLINGDQSLATGNVSVSANATLGGTGTIGGNTTISANGRLEFNLSTADATHNKLELATGKSLAFSGASVLTITSGGGASPGSYTLITAPGGITGNAPATLNLPSGWEATVSKVGNDLVLEVTSTGSVPDPFEAWADDNELTGEDALVEGDPDRDGLKNLLEFAFGTDPRLGRTGAVLLDQDGNVVSPGMPLIRASGAQTGAPPFDAIYARRKDHQAAGLDYVVEFSADLREWTASAAGLEVLSTGQAGEMEAVSVPFPVTVPLLDPEAPHQEPRFFRVAVSEP